MCFKCHGMDGGGKEGSQGRGENKTTTSVLSPIPAPASLSLFSHSVHVCRILTDRTKGLFQTHLICSVLWHCTPRPSQAVCVTMFVQPGVCVFCGVEWTFLVCSHVGGHWEVPGGVFQNKQRYQEWSGRWQEDQPFIDCQSQAMNIHRYWDGVVCRFIMKPLMYDIIHSWYN